MNRMRNAFALLDPYLAPPWRDPVEPGDREPEDEPIHLAVPGEYELATPVDPDADVDEVF